MASLTGIFDDATDMANGLNPYLGLAKEMDADIPAMTNRKISPNQRFGLGALNTLGDLLMQGFAASDRRNAEAESARKQNALLGAFVAGSPLPEDAADNPLLGKLMLYGLERQAASAQADKEMQGKLLGEFAKSPRGAKLLGDYLLGGGAISNVSKPGALSSLVAASPELPKGQDSSEDPVLDKAFRDYQSNIYNEGMDESAAAKKYKADVESVMLDKRERAKEEEQARKDEVKSRKEALTKWEKKSQAFQGMQEALGEFGRSTLVRPESGLGGILLDLGTFFGVGGDERMQAKLADKLTGFRKITELSGLGIGRIMQAEMPFLTGFIDDLGSGKATKEGAKKAYDILTKLNERVGDELEAERIYLKKRLGPADEFGFLEQAHAAKFPMVDPKTLQYTKAPSLSELIRKGYTDPEAILGLEDATALTPSSQTSPFKAGDVRYKNGKAYQRQADGTWVGM